MRYNTELGQNNTELQAILDTVNALPEAGVLPEGKIEIIENGIYDVAEYANAEVKVSGEDYLRYASSVQFNNLNIFGKSEIVVTLNESVNIASIFRQDTEVNTTLEHITLNVKKPVTNANACFYVLSKVLDNMLKHITFNVDISNVVNFASLFMNLRALTIIDGTPLDVSSATSINGIFAGCIALKEIRFKENSIKVALSCNNSSLLSSESIQSIIDGLADLTGGTGQTLTLHADVKAKLTEEQITTITSKNWTLA